MVGDVHEEQVSAEAMAHDHEEEGASVEPVQGTQVEALDWVVHAEQTVEAVSS